MFNKKEVCVALIVYRAPIPSEKLSIKCLTSVLGNYDLFIVKPESLSISLDGFATASLPNKWFVSTRSYGLLLASSDFYNLFSDYNWVLIYQPDCLVFTDELKHWCRSQSDYLSSVCFAEYHPWTNKDFVGFGGLHLRRVQPCLDTLAIIEGNPLLLAHHQAEILTYGQEDVFWSWSAPKINNSFKILSVEDSLRFSWNGDPRRYASRSHIAPFAIHGFLSLYAFVYYYRWLPLSTGDKIIYGIPALIQIFGREVNARLRRQILKIRIKLRISVSHAK